MNGIKCRVCAKKGDFDGLLFKCSECKAVHWDKMKVKKLFYKVKKGTEEFQTIKKEILTAAKFPKPQGKYVYTLRLKSKPKYLYVGMTGLHPYERYLNHIIGYKSSLYAKKYATAMMEFEGPMKNEIAIKREVSKGNEWRNKGYVVEGAPVKLTNSLIH